MTNSESPLAGKQVLIVDDEPDILETLNELLYMCIVHHALDYDTAVDLMSKHSYDVVILDIQGVDGFELLRIAVSKDFPTMMLTAHVATPESLKKSVELGAFAFLPKDYMMEVQELLEDVIVNGGGKRFWWMKSLERTDTFFKKRYGSDWKQKDAFFKEFQQSLIKNKS